MEYNTYAGVSQNISWTLEKCSTIVHILVTVAVNLIFRTFFKPTTAWALTVLAYNCTTFLFFHWIVGDPFDHSFSDCTFWEQMTEQLGYSQGMYFMTVFPVMLFIVSSHIVRWGYKTYWLCTFSLCIVMIPKLEFMHKRRIFGINQA